MNQGFKFSEKDRDLGATEETIEFQREIAENLQKKNVVAAKVQRKRLKLTKKNSLISMNFVKNSKKEDDDLGERSSAVADIELGVIPTQRHLI